MSWLFKVAIEGRLDEAMAVEEEIARRAITGGVRLAASYTQNAYRRQVRDRMGTFGGRGGVEKAWQRNDFPRAGQFSMKAASQVYSKATRIVDAFSQDRVVKPHSGEGLLVPTQWAIQNGLDKISGRYKGGIPRRYMKREDLEARLGPLFEIKRPDGQVLLCYKDQLGTIRAVAYVKRSVRLRKLFDLDAPKLKFAAALPRYIVQAMNRAERPKRPSGVIVRVEG